LQHSKAFVFTVLRIISWPYIMFMWKVLDHASMSNLRQVGLIFTFGHWRFGMESRMLNIYRRFSIFHHVYTNCFNKIMIKNELST